jgi:hypothetical protein
LFHLSLGLAYSRLLRERFPRLCGAPASIVLLS